MEEEFPRKEFYTIGEVSRLTGVPTHMLRYWETRGKLLKPQRRRSRHRVYRFSDRNSSWRSSASGKKIDSP